MSDDNLPRWPTVVSMVGAGLAAVVLCVPRMLGRKKVRLVSIPTWNDYGENSTVMPALPYIYRQR